MVILYENFQESLGYAAVPPMGGRNYAGSAPWMYLLAEVPRDSQVIVFTTVSYYIGGHMRLK